MAKVKTDSNPLFHILSHKRPYGSKSDEQIIKEFLLPLPESRQDAFGNVIVQVGDKNSSSTLFSCHTDTVHRNCGRQRIMLDANKNTLFKDDKHPLGADDGAGMWLLMEMIAEKIPGLYIFHRGEECGGLGSSFIVSDTPELLSGIDRAIAFDRRGTTDIINYQFVGRCASDAFVTQLSDQLNMGHKPARGSFTDTANYTDLVSECTNISVGYDREHSPNETQDLTYLYKLRDALMDVNWEELEPSRVPGEQEQFTWTSRRNYGWNDFNDYEVDIPKALGTLTYNELYKIVILEPEVATQLLLDSSITSREVKETREQMQPLANIIGD